MEYRIHVQNNGHFVLQQYLNNGHLAAEMILFDELSLFRELAELLGVSFKEKRENWPLLKNDFSK